MRMCTPVSLITAWLVLAGGADLQAEPAPAAPAAPYQLPVGETLVYSVLWGIIPVGTTIVSVEQAAPPHENQVVIRMRTQSNKVLATLYPVDDVIESYVNPETLLPVKFVKQLNEGRYHLHEETSFDHAKGTATLRKIRSGKTSTYPINKDTRDLLAFLYSMRNDRLEPGEELQRQVMADEKLYDLFIRAKNVEEINLPYHGKVPSLKVVPEAAFQGLFVRKGSMTLWVSTDTRRILTKLSADTPFANVNVKLVKVTNGGEDFWTNPPKQAKKKSKSSRRKGR